MQYKSDRVPLRYKKLTVAIQFRTRKVPFETQNGHSESRQYNGGKVSLEIQKGFSIYAAPNMQYLCGTTVE
jgi:hypothetical protein